jgi:hypothetical protein
MSNARPAEGERQEMKIRVSLFTARLQQPHGDEEESIGKKRATQPGHGARIQYGRCDDLKACLLIALQ